MAHLAQLAVILVFGYLICQSFAMPASSDEERFLEKEYNGAILNWLMSYHVPQRLNNFCKYYSGNPNLLSPQMPKRNSELINSLLSLPKNMNDAGKK